MLSMLINWPPTKKHHLSHGKTNPDGVVFLLVGRGGGGGDRKWYLERDQLLPFTPVESLNLIEHLHPLSYPTYTFSSFSYLLDRYFYHSFFYSSQFLCLPSCCMRAFLPACLPVACLPSCLPAFLLHVCLPACDACLPACQPTRLPAYLPACLPACMPVCLSAS